MPFCSHCGHEVHPQDAFCAKCGSSQPVPSAPIPNSGSQRANDILAGISPRTASILCYLPTLGWIAAVIVLATHRFRTNRTVRFHAFQGLYLFAAWLFVQWALKPVFSDAPVHPDHLLDWIIIGVWIFMMIKAAHEEAYSLPVIGELAQKSAAER
jgi:uncharacterized membrane protein